MINALRFHELDCECTEVFQPVLRPRPCKPIAFQALFDGLAILLIKGLEEICLSQLLEPFDAISKNELDAPRRCCVCLHTKAPLLKFHFVRWASFTASTTMGAEIWPTATVKLSLPCVDARA